MSNGDAKILVRDADGRLSEIGFAPESASMPVAIQNGLTVTATVSIGTVIAGGTTVISGGMLQGITNTVTVRDTSNPPVQLSGGMLQGISNTVNVAGNLTLVPSSLPTVVQAATSNGLTVNGSFSVSFPDVQKVMSATLAGVTVTGTLSTTPSSAPQNVQAATTNGLTVNGTVTANQGGAPWSTTISGTPSVSVANNPQVQVSGGTLTGISNTVTVSITGQPVQVSAASSVPVQAATSNGLTVTGTLTENQGTPAAAANAWPVKVSDGSDTVGISTVSGAKALKVDVVQSVAAGGGGGPTQVMAATTNGVTVTGSLSLTPSSQPTPVQAATTNGLTINGSVGQSGAPWSVTISGAPSVTAAATLPVQAATSNGLTVNGAVTVSSGTVTANQGGAPWSTTISGTVATTVAQPVAVQAATSNGLTVTGAVTVASTTITGNPPMQISGGTLTGISNTVTVQGTVTANVAQPLAVQAAVANGITTSRSWTLNAATDGVTIANIVTIQGNQGGRTSGTITSATSVVGPVTASNLNIFTITVNGTYSGVSFVFEGSDDGQNWYLLQGARSDQFLNENGGSLLTNATVAWDVAVGGYLNFRVRATAWTSGTANIAINGQSMPYEPTPTVGQLNAAMLNATVVPSSVNGLTVALLGNLLLQQQTQQTALLQQMLIEMRVQNVVLAMGLNIKDDLDAIRNDLFTALPDQTAIFE